MKSNITKPSIECKYPVGNGITKPVYQNGPSNLITTKSASMKNEGTDITGTASEANLSAQFKNPRVKQEIPSEGRNQYQ